MFAQLDKQVHWTQRVALIRHNLHAACRTGDFSFFKILQANAFLQGTDYVAILTAALNDEADSVINTLDKLNAGIAYVFQDAFKSVYDNVKGIAIGHQDDIEAVKTRVRIEVIEQIQRADFALDRIVDSAIALAQLQPQEHQHAVACTWILGVTIVTDAVSVCVREMMSIDGYLKAFTRGEHNRVEHSWTSVQVCVESSVTAVRGILNLMAVDENTEEFKRRSSSSVSALQMFRKLSTAIGGLHLSNPPPPYKASRSASTASTRMSSISTQSSPSALRTCFSNTVPTKVGMTPRHSVGNTSMNSMHKANGMTSLAPIPATPGIANEFADPFDMPSP